MCHPDRPRKLKDGTCDSCYAKNRYNNDPIVRERVKAIARRSWHKKEREYTDEQKETRRLAANRRYKENPATAWSYHMKAKYNLTEAEYTKMLLEQDNVCAICKNVNEKSKRKLAVDHDHNTGEVRGILCSRCNIGLGHFGDNEELLRRAYEYLQYGRNESDKATEI